MAGAPAHAFRGGTWVCVDRVDGAYHRPVLFGGVAADRLPRRGVLLCSDAGRAVVVLGIALLGWMHLLQFWHLVALVIFFSVVDAFFGPAYTSVFPQLVVREQLSSANALTSVSQQIGKVAGPVMAGGLIAVSGPASAFAFDAFTFLVSALCLAALQVPSYANTVKEPDAPPTRSGLTGIVADMREGIGYMRGHAWLWVSTVAIALASPAYFGPWVVALPRLVHDVYGAGPSLFGVLVTAKGVGAIATTLLVGQLSRPRARGLMAYAALVGANVGLLVMGLPLARAGQPIVPVVACCAFGSGLAIFNLIWTTIVQELVPLSRLGRITGVDYFGATALQPVGYAVAGVLADHAGPAWAIGLGGASGALIAGAPLLVPAIRTMR